LRGGWTSLLRRVAEDRRAGDREETSSPDSIRNLLVSNYIFFMYLQETCTTLIALLICTSGLR